MKCESCKKKNDCIGYGKTPVCGAYVSEKNPTHGDKIRSMSDKELAEFLFENCTGDCCENCMFKPHGNGRHTRKECNNGNCHSTILEWLQSEAKEM